MRTCVFEGTYVKCPGLPKVSVFAIDTMLYQRVFVRLPNDVLEFNSIDNAAEYLYNLYIEAYLNKIITEVE